MSCDNGTCSKSFDPKAELEQATIVVEAMAAAMREALGAFSSSKKVIHASVLLGRQYRALAASKAFAGGAATIGAATREALRRRFEAMLISEAVADKVIDAASGPSHPHLLLVHSDEMLRGGCWSTAKAADEPPNPMSVLMAMMTAAKRDEHDEHEDI